MINIKKASSSTTMKSAFVGMGATLMLMCINPVTNIVDRHVQNEAYSADLRDVETMLVDVLTLVVGGGFTGAATGRLLSKGSRLYTRKGMIGPNKEDIEAEENPEGMTGSFLSRFK